MTDHWKDVNDAVNEVEEGGDWPPKLADRLRDSIDAAREEDAEAHAAALAAKDAEIADLTRTLHWFTSYTPCHWTKGEIEYKTDCGQVAFPVSKVPDGTCHGCGRPIVVSVVEKTHDVPPEERDRP